MPFHKPLVEVDGTPLVVNIVQNLQAHNSYVDRVVVVCAPENALKIRDALQAAGCLRSNLRLVVQPVADGAANGLIAGLEACRTGRVLVVCGDNVIPDEDLLTMLVQANNYVVMFKTVTDLDEANRLTRITPGGKFEDHHLPFAAKDDTWRVWLGPLVVLRSRALICLYEVNEELSPFEEARIQDALNKMGGYPTLIEGNCFDIGTPEALKEVM